MSVPCHLSHENKGIGVDAAGSPVAYAPSENQSLTILLIISEEPPIISGISRVAMELRRGLESLGNRVDIISLSEVPRLVLGEMRVSSMLWKGPALLRRLQQYDVVHVQGPAPTFSDIALLLSTLPKRKVTPVVIYTHHCDVDIRGHRFLCALYNRMHKHLSRRADQVVVTTPAYARELVHYKPPQNVSIIPWGVDTSWCDAQYSKAERFTALFVGQLRPYKGLETLLNAARRVKKMDLHVIGSGHQQAHYRALAAERGLSNVTFHGRVSEEFLHAAFRKAHTVVLPSNTRAEAFGLVLLEGMAAGCIPVVSQLPGVTDVVGDAGYTFPVGDENALVAALIQLRDNQLLRAHYASRARVRARQYSWPNTAFRHQLLYHQTIATRQFKVTSPTSQNSLSKLLHAAVTALGASAGSIMLIEPKDNTLKLMATCGLPVEVRVGDCQPLKQGVAGYVASFSQPLLLPQAFTSALSKGWVLSQQRTHISSSLSVPIKSGNQTLGVINVSTYMNSRQFDQDDLLWLNTLAQHAGLTIGQARTSRNWSFIS